MAMKDGDSYGGKGLHWPAVDEHKNTVIWMHGLGDTANGWASLPQQFQKMQGTDPSVRHTKFILPTAPSRKIRINGDLPMPGWANIYGFGLDAEEDLEGYLGSRDRVMNIIKGEVEKGIQAEKIVVGGFSQGGALAYLVGLTLPKNIFGEKADASRLGGIVGCSCWLPLRNWVSEQLKDDLSGLPILHCHGKDDDLIPVEAGKMSSQLVQSVLPRVKVEYKEYKGMGHSACEEELGDVQAFISKCLK